MMIYHLNFGISNMFPSQLNDKHVPREGLAGTSPETISPNPPLLFPAKVKCEAAERTSKRSGSGSNLGAQNRDWTRHWPSTPRVLGMVFSSRDHPKTSPVFRCQKPTKNEGSVCEQGQEMSILFVIAQAKFILHIDTYIVYYSMSYNIYIQYIPWHPHHIPDCSCSSHSFRISRRGLLLPRAWPRSEFTSTTWMNQNDCRKSCIAWPKIKV